MKRLVDLWLGPTSRKPVVCLLQRKVMSAGLKASVSKSGSYLSVNCVGLLWNSSALWVGAHYSKRDKRLCINLVPCLTFWWAKPGGKCP